MAPFLNTIIFFLKLDNIVYKVRFIENGTLFFKPMIFFGNKKCFRIGFE